MTLIHFTTLIPVEAGREEALHKTLNKLERREKSPFQGLGGTHMVRLYILDHYGGTRRGNVYHRRLDAPLLVFSAVVDGPVGPWLGRLHHGLEDTVEEIWTHCVGFPGMSNRTAFVQWLLKGEVAPTFPLIAHPKAGVETVRMGLKRRSQLGRLAVEVQGAAPAIVRAAYRRVFGR